MKRALLTLCAVASVALVAAGCGSDDGDGSAEPPAATLGTASTTSTTLSVEAEVEAAYLRSWDVFAAAALELDPSNLERSYARSALEVVTANINRYVTNNTPVRYEVEHNYVITVAGDVATVVDSYTNHSVLLDPVTMQPTEPDPNERLVETYELERIDGTWKVVAITRS